MKQFFLKVSKDQFPPLSHTHAEKTYIQLPLDSLATLVVDMAELTGHRCTHTPETFVYCVCVLSSN